MIKWLFYIVKHFTSEKVLHQLKIENFTYLEKTKFTTCPPGRRKLAVVACCLTGGGMLVLPRAIPTIAVMWVSGPNTWIGTPNVSPEI